MFRYAAGKLTYKKLFYWPRFDTFAIEIPMKPKVTVVIPAYNAASYIQTSISSVLSQTLTEWELMVVNDGSNDNTEALIKEYVQDNRIQLVTQPNLGVSAARNKGIALAKGKYIAFLDADDAYLPDNLQKKFNLLENNSGADFVYSDIWKCDKNLEPLFIEKGVQAENLFKEVLLWKAETIPGFSSNIMVRAKSVKEKFLFDENLSNCADRYMKIVLSKNLHGAYIPEPLSKYRDTPGAMSKNVGLLEHDEEYIIKKIRELNIIPRGTYRQMIIARIYFMLSGSWYKNAHNPLKALKYGIKALVTYPPLIFKLIRKTGKQLLP